MYHKCNKKKGEQCTEGAKEALVTGGNVSDQVPKICSRMAQAVKPVLFLM